MTPHAIRIDASLPEPVWSQIEDGVRRLVATRVLEPGASIPSVRELARELRVNPATVSRAYQSLVTQGVLEVRRGDGTFVADAPPTIRHAERERLLREAATRYASVALTLGVAREEATREVAAVWGAMAGGKGKSA